jgi:hypothetical protein
MKSKLFFKSLAIVVLGLNLGLLGFTPTNAQSDQTLLPTDQFTCKWLNEECPSFDREICVRDGTGNTCNCGDVTRSCS